MKTLLVAIVLLMNASAMAQGVQPMRLKDAVADFPRSRLQLKTNGPVTLEVTRGERAAYEALAAMAGLNIVIDPDFRDTGAAPMRLENTNVLEAFDLLSVRSGSFIEVINSNTIVVSPDSPTKRRDYEFIVLKTFYLPNASSPQRLTELITTLRTALNARYLAQSTTANAIVMRDSSSRIAAAEKLIGLGVPLVTGPAAASMGEAVSGVGHILTMEGGALRDSTPARSGLIVPGNRVTLELKDSTRAIFENLAEVAQLNVIFDPDFRSLDAQTFKVDNLGVLDALDVLALQTRTFWEPVDRQTIVVAPDNASKRRTFENLQVKAFYLANASSVEMVEIVTALRTILNVRYLGSLADSKTVVIRDSANRLALAEKLITDLRKSGGVITSAGFPTGSEAGGFVLSRRAAQIVTQAPSPLSAGRAPLAFRMNDTARATYEAVASAAGLRVVFDNRFQDSAAVPFRVNRVGIADALDLLALETGTFWQMMGDTVIVAPDNASTRSDLLPRITTPADPSTTARRNLTEIVTALRSVLNLRQVSTLGNAVVMTDTAENIAFAERMLADLEKTAR